MAFDGSTARELILLSIAVAAATYGVTKFIEIQPLKQELDTARGQLAEFLEGQRSAPLVLSVTPETRSEDGQNVIVQQVHFRDPEGDAYMLGYLISDTEATRASATGALISADPDEQKQGAVVEGRWRCGSNNYTVSLLAIIIDKAGNRSKPYAYTIKCP